MTWEQGGEWVSQGQLQLREHRDASEVKSMGWGPAMGPGESWPALCVWQTTQGRNSESQTWTEAKMGEVWKGTKNGFHRHIPQQDEHQGKDGAAAQWGRWPSLKGLWRSRGDSKPWLTLHWQLLFSTLHWQGLFSGLLVSLCLQCPRRSLGEKMLPIVQKDWVMDHLSTLVEYKSPVSRWDASEGRKDKLAYITAKLLLSLRDPFQPVWFSETTILWWFVECRQISCFLMNNEWN